MGGAAELAATTSVMDAMPAVAPRPRMGSAAEARPAASRLRPATDVTFAPAGRG